MSFQRRDGSLLPVGILVAGAVAGYAFGQYVGATAMAVILLAFAVAWALWPK